MLSKRPRPDDPEDLPATRRFASNVNNLYSSNQISGRRAMDSTRDSVYAGSLPNRMPVNILSTSAAHQIWRGAFKGQVKQWPDVYWTRIRVWNSRRSCEQYEWVAMHLVHEIMDMIAKYGTLDVYGSTEEMDPESLAHLEYVKRESNIDDLIGVGLHGDGVPCNWDRSESVNVLSLNLPGVAGRYKNMRIPLLTLMQSQVSEHTWDDVMEIVSWSMRHAFLGKQPGARHDQQPWLKSDSKRSGMASQNLRLKSCLVEVRGDWKFFKETFHLPQWNENAGICWSCTCTPQQVAIDKLYKPYT